MIIIYWILFIILLILSAFFSSTEVALLGSEIHKLKSEKIKHLLRRPQRIIISVLIGNEFVNISATVVFTVIFISYFGVGKTFLSVLFMTSILLFFGEITPKTVAFSNPERFAKRIEPVFIRYFKLVKPLISVLVKISGYIVYLITGEVNLTEQRNSNDEFLEKINDSNLPQRQKILFQRALFFYELKARDIMTPLSDYPFIFTDSQKPYIREKIKEKRNIGMPILSTDSDSIFGILNVKRYILTDNFIKSISAPKFIPESYPAFDLLSEIDYYPEKTAIVVDEYGGAYGVITKEILIENLTGRIYKPVFSADEKSAVVLASTKLFELENTLNIKFDYPDKSDSLNAFILRHIGRIPDKSEEVVINGYKFIILSRTRRVILKVKFEYK